VLPTVLGSLNLEWSQAAQNCRLSAEPAESVPTYLPVGQVEKEFFLTQVTSNLLV
jgi:hypothetical protein